MEINILKGFRQYSPEALRDYSTCEECVYDKIFN